MEDRVKGKFKGQEEITYSNSPSCPVLLLILLTNTHNKVFNQDIFL